MLLRFFALMLRRKAERYNDMKKGVVSALRRRSREILGESMKGSLFTRYPNFTISTAAWLVADLTYLDFASPGHSVSCIRLENIDNVSRELLIHHAPPEELVLFLHAMSVLPTCVRDNPMVMRTVDCVLASAILKVDSFSLAEALTLLRQLPAVGYVKRSEKVAWLGVKIVNRFVTSFDKMDIGELALFFQFIGSVLTRQEAKAALRAIDFLQLNTTLKALLPRKDVYRRVIPQVLIMLSKLHELGLPLSPIFAPALSNYITFCVKTRKVTYNEALRTLYAISRVRLVSFSTSFPEEVGELLGVIAEANLEHLEGIELSMLVHCLTFDAPSDAESSVTAGVISSTGGEAQGPVALALHDSRRRLHILEKIASSMTSKVNTLSVRGYLTFCRSAALLSRSFPAMLSSTALAEAVVNHSQRLISQDVYGHTPLREKLTIIVAANPFSAATASTRSMTQDTVRQLLELHAHEGMTATNASLLLSALSSAFGASLDATEFGAIPVPSPAKIRQISHVQELDPRLLSVLVIKAIGSTRLAQYSYSSILRSFCRLGMEYSEVEPFCRRLFDLRNSFALSDAQVKNVVSRQNRGRMESKSPSAKHDTHQIAAELDDQALSVQSIQHETDDTAGKSFGLVLLSEHMAGIVFSCLLSLRCSDPQLLSYVLLMLRCHHDGELPPRLVELQREAFAMVPDTMRLVVVEDLKS